MRQSGGADTAYISGGTYYQDTPIQLTSEDSGSSFVAADGEKVVVSGGTPVTGWTQGENGIWTAQVDDAQVLQLTVNGVQQTESRYPDVDPDDPVRGGWLWGQDLPEGYDSTQSLAFDPDDYTEGHYPEAGQTVTVYSENGYSSERLTIASVEGNVITFTTEANYELGSASRYYISEDTPDQVGEWSYDAETGTVQYKAPDDFTGEGAVVSDDQSLFVVDGASDVTIKGLTLTDTAAETGDPETAAVEAHDATGLTVEGNHFVNVGVGVALHGDSSGNTITGNQFEHTWSSAIALTPGTSENTISNNVIDQSNEVFVQYGSISMVESAHNQVDHNTITNVPRFGISEINYDPDQESGGNVIEYNDIRHSGQETPDVGAIYLFSHEDPGAEGDTIRYNNIVDTGGVNTRDGEFVPGNDMSSGIYLDNLASNAEIYGNTVQGTAFSGILVHGGSNNDIHDNTLLDNGKYGIATIGVDGHEITGNETYENFIEVSGDGSNTIDTDQTDPSLIHDNVYYNPDDAELTIADVSLTEFQQQGGDAGSVVTTQAGFTNAEEGDYTFTEGSVAHAHGIESPAFGSAGSNVQPIDDMPDTSPGTGGTPPVTAEPDEPAEEDPSTPQEPTVPVDETPDTGGTPPVTAEPDEPAGEDPSTPAEPTVPVEETPETGGTPPVNAEPDEPAGETPPVSNPAEDPDVITIPEVDPLPETDVPETSNPWSGWGGRHSSRDDHGGRNRFQENRDSHDDDNGGHGGGRNWFQESRVRHDDDDNHRGHSSHWHW